MSETISNEQVTLLLRTHRGITDPCPKCSGWGKRVYSSTAAWRGGIGGQALTMGVCDACWGSGEEGRPWLNLRKLGKQMRDREPVDPGPI